MSTNYLITGTGARVGKTVVGCALGFAFRARGLRVGVMKPVETGCDPRGAELDPADTRALALASGCALPIEVMCPYRYRSPLTPRAAAQADSAPEPDLGVIHDCFDRIAAASDIVLVESPGSLSEGLNRDADFTDLALALGLAAIVVIANRRGGIEAAIDTLGHAAQKGLGVAGWIMNDADPLTLPDAPRAAALLSARTAVPCLGTMRFKEPLGIQAVEQLLARHRR